MALRGKPAPPLEDGEPDVPEEHVPARKCCGYNTRLDIEKHAGKPIMMGGMARYADSCKRGFTMGARVRKFRGEVSLKDDGSMSVKSHECSVDLGPEEDWCKQC
eukprot:12397976-Karenia_brevis.AAC.1